MSVPARIALGKRTVADAAQLHDRGLAVGEVGIAVAEVFRQVEAEPVGELDGALDGVAVVGKRSNASASASRTLS